MHCSSWIREDLRCEICLKAITLLILLFLQSQAFAAVVELGVDVYFEQEQWKELKGKRVGLVTNHTGIDSGWRSTMERFITHVPKIQLCALFAPEHGIYGEARAFDKIEDQVGPSGIPIYSLHGQTRRPTEQMLKNLDVIIFDIQDIGCRTYTYTTTLYYVMEEAAKRGIPVIVFDRPNPINGMVVDGPMLKEQYRSFIGYVNVPYCHGMTIGELACYFNEEYQIHCKLKVVCMKGWKREMSFSDTGLTWIPTSPYIPEPDTPLFYATTGIIGELSLVNIGIGYTLPFKVIGAPWIKAKDFAAKLNEQKLSGVHFFPFHYRPFYGPYKGKECQGVMITVTDPHTFRPVTTQYMLLGVLKNLYPKQIASQLRSLEQGKKSLFCKANGNEEMLQILLKEKYAAWKLILYQKEEREQFLKTRKKYLLYD